MRTASAALALVIAAACDGGLEPEPIPTSCPAGFVGVCGTIRFRGAIPDSTDNVFVIAYTTFPQTCNDLFTFRPLPPPPVPYGDSTAFYTLPLPDGRYEWLLAVWKKVGMLTFSIADTALLREAGHYRDPADTTQPGVVVVSGTGRDSIDFAVNFDSMRTVSSYFTSCAVTR
ncbi:MAG: hypothetical protein ACRD08_12120 [Acidimicrobiales bacterium]